MWTRVLQSPTSYLLPCSPWNGAHPLNFPGNFFPARLFATLTACFFFVLLPPLSLQYLRKSVPRLAKIKNCWHAHDHHQYMDAPTLCSVSGVCKEWRRQGNDDQYWSRLCRARCVGLGRWACNFRGHSIALPFHVCVCVRVFVCVCFVRVLPGCLAAVLLEAGA